MKNKKYEIIEESRFLSVNEMDNTKGGVDACAFRHEFCNPKFVVEPCAKDFVTYCGPVGGAVAFESCRLIKDKICIEIYTVEQ